MGGVFTFGEVKNSGGGEISTVAARLGIVVVRLETMVECVFEFKRSCSGE
ncbi:hypothetical protein Goshw_012667, partial [Gossypium schwendimanii]|nr:hypothetical protein [Gossypium schwendimanii]